MVVCLKTGLPLAWRIETARARESKAVALLLDKLHTLGIDPRRPRARSIRVGGVG